MKLRIALGADHGGYHLKNELAFRLADRYDINDMGAHSFDPDDDYPDIAELVARELFSGNAHRGILVCGSGVGACIAANKVLGSRVCVCHDTYSARQAVEHDDMNVLCLGARIIGIELSYELVSAFLGAVFSGEERHRRRLEKVLAIEHQAFRTKEI